MRPRHAPKLQHRGMKPTLVQYDAPGWGVGEVWLDDDGVVFHSRAAPARSGPVGRGQSPGHVLAGRLVAVLRGRAGRLRRRRSCDSTTASTATARACCGRCRAARSSPTASSPRSPAARARPARPARSARAASSRRSCRCTASSRPTGSAARAASGSTTSGDCWSWRALLSEDLRDELAQIAPRRRCCRQAELSALFHASGCLAPARRRGRGPPRSRELRRRAPRVRAPARPRRAVGDPHLPPPRLRPGDALPAARRRRRPRTRASCARPACSPRRARRSSTRRSGSSAARAAAAPTFAARSSAAGRSPARATRTSSSRTSGIDGAQFIAEVAAREDVKLARRRAARPRRRVREGPRGDRRPARSRRGERHGAPARGARRPRRDPRPGEPARERRRGEPRAGRARRARQLEAIRALDLDSLPPQLAEIAELRLRHPSASLARARGEGSPADHEGSPRTAASALSCVASKRRTPRLATPLAKYSAAAPYSRLWRVRARPTVDTDPVHRQRTRARFIRRGRSSSELPLRPATIATLI